MDEKDLKVKLADLFLIARELTGQQQSINNQINQVILKLRERKQSDADATHDAGGPSAAEGECNG